MVEYGNRWGDDGPPPEAYSRVTNPERFRPVIEFTEALLARLERTFQVEREESYGLDSLLEQGKLIRAPVKLSPAKVRAAPVTIAFTDFPGVGALFGRWHRSWFPSCGCDACDETANTAIQGLQSTVEAVTAGRFREAIVRDAERVLWLQHELLHDKGRSAGSMRIEPENVRTWLGGDEEEALIEWEPWPLRTKTNDEPLN
jgi:hypothetical protein